MVQQKSHTRCKLECKKPPPQNNFKTNRVYSVCDFREITHGVEWENAVTLVINTKKNTNSFKYFLILIE